MSIAFDSFWWWRSEFDGRSSPCRSPEATLTNDGYAIETTTTLQEEAFGGELDPHMTLYSDLHTISPSSLDFANWHWPAGLTFDDGHMPLPALY
jgi:hypothetical protein